MGNAPRESVGDSATRRRLRRYAGLAIWASAVAISIITLLIVVSWMQTLPRSARRAIVEWSLRATLVGYALAVSGAIAGVCLLGSLAIQRGQGKVRKPWAKRLALACIMSVFCLPMAEITAAIWLAWARRMPDLPTRFDPPDGREHLVVLGGSAALGHPYAPHVSVSQIVAWQLECQLPGRRFQVDMLAMLSGSLEDMHRKLVNLQQRPSVIVIEAGHNEFPSRFDTERNVDLDEAPPNRFVDVLYRGSLWSPLCRSMYRALTENRLDGPPPQVSEHRLIDAPMYTPSEGVAVLDNFHKRLEAIVSYCEQIGALPVLIIEPGNEADFPPNRSVLPAYATEADRRWVESQYLAAKQAQSTGDQVAAAARFGEIVERQPRFAEGHFQLARVLENEGRYTEAREHYLQARDLDGMTLRCTSALQSAIRQVAARHRTAILIDGPAAVSAICPHQIVDDHAMQDAVHLSLRGMTATAQAVLRELRSRQALGWRRGDAPSLDVAGVAARFGVGLKEWQTVCGWGQGYYQWASGLRFDPSEHIIKARKFGECKKRLAEGTPPGAIGFAPLSLAPLTAPTSVALTSSHQ